MYTRFVSVLFFACLSAVVVIFSLALSTSEPHQVVALSASAIEALHARNAYANVSILAQSAIVEDIDTGVVVFEKNPYIQLPLASLTKVPLVLAASEVLQPDAIITIPHDTTFNSKASQLHTGEKWRAGDLVAYLLVASYNDVAQILSDAANEALQAKYPQAGANATLWRMNNLAKTLGLHSMYFLNPTGLDESETQSGAYGSARDVAALFSYAQKNYSLLFLGTATTSVSITSLEGRTVTATNTDEVLDEVPGIIMGKTGTTDLAGGNLAVIFTSGAKTYVAVALGSTQSGRFSDIRQLILATRSISGQ